MIHRKDRCVLDQKNLKFATDPSSFDKITGPTILDAMETLTTEGMIQGKDHCILDQKKLRIVTDPPSFSKITGSTILDDKIMTANSPATIKQKLTNTIGSMDKKRYKNVWNPTTKPSEHETSLLSMHTMFD